MVVRGLRKTGKNKGTLKKGYKWGPKKGGKRRPVKVRKKK